MTSFIITGGEDQQRMDEVLSVCSTHSIDKIDVTTITFEKESSLGIEAVKKLQEKVFLKPLKSLSKAVVIPNAHLLTIPAQNSLLKLLEEPPANTLLFLVADSLEALLPTIRSRCKILKISTPEKQLSTEEVKEFKSKLQDWKNLSVTQALKTAEILAKDKETTLDQLENMIIVARSVLLDNLSKEKPVILDREIRLLQQAYRILKTTNTNPRLTLEDLLFKFSH